MITDFERQINVFHKVCSTPFQTYTPITRFLWTRFKSSASTKTQRARGKQVLREILSYFFVVLEKKHVYGWPFDALITQVLQTDSKTGVEYKTHL